VANVRLRAIGSALAAGTVGVMVALAVGSPGAAGSQTVTLGSTSGTPTRNICAGSINCTYVPFSNLSTPELQVPFGGTVTRFSVNAGSTGGKVELRVLRPAGGSQYIGAGTSPGETLTTTGVNKFNVSLPVKAGDVLGLDNDSSAVMFDISSATPVTYYYELPSLADGTTAAPNRTQKGDRLLLSAEVQQSPGSTNSNTTGTMTQPTTLILANVGESHARWREGSALPKLASAPKPPVGTTFRFTLNELARVRFAFTQRLPGRRVNGRCVAPTSANVGRPACTRTLTAGAFSFAATAGAHRVRFQGRISKHKKLKPGRYTLIITATNPAGQRASSRLTFTIVT
jgi:hypothetical protein